MNPPTGADRTLLRSARIRRRLVFISYQTYPSSEADRLRDWPLYIVRVFVFDIFHIPIPYLSITQGSA